MKDFFNSIGNWFVNNIKQITTTVAIIIFGIIIVKILLALIRRRLSKTKLEKTVQSFICSILKFVFYLILIFSVIASLGISITGLTVVVTAISLAISLALQDSLKNLVNGFIIISTKLLKQGDWVEIGSAEGSVIDVRMLYTILKTADNKKVTIPNSTVLSNNVINYNTLKFRRLDVNFNLAYDCNVDLAKDVLRNVINACDMIYNDPKPQVILTNLGDSSITLTARIWCSSADYWDVKWYLIDNCFNELKKNNLNIPFNQLEVALVDPNKPSYVREQTLVSKENHKAKPGEEEDIITSINKTIEKTKEKRKKFINDIKEKNKKRKAQRAEKKAEKKKANNKK